MEERVAKQKQHALYLCNFIIQKMHIGKTKKIRCAGVTDRVANA